MATYYLSSVNGNDADNGTTWDLAKATFAGALAVATTAGDIIKVSHVHQEELAADTAFTLGANITIVSVNRDSSDALTPMGTGGWIGNSTTNRYIRLEGADRTCYFYGITFRVSGSTADQIIFANATGASQYFDSCYLWQGSTADDVTMMKIGAVSAGYAEFHNCTFRFGHTGQGLFVTGAAKFIKCSISADGSAPAILVRSNTNGGQGPECIGCDWSAITGTIVGNLATNQFWRFDRCKFASGATLFAAQTSNPTLDSASAWFSDCLVGTTRVTGYYDALGSAVRETGIYYTDSDAGDESWKVVTTANASYRMPFKTPWVDWYNTGTSEVTPRFEILRDGSTTAYKDSEIWAEFSWKNTSSSPVASGLQDDRQALSAFVAGTAGSDQAGGAGTAAWTGDTGAWSGKVDSGSAITPTESGYLRGRVCVAVASATVYVDPVIRTA